MPGLISPAVEWDVVYKTEGVGGWFGRTGIEISVPKKLIEGISADARWDVAELAKKIENVLFEDAARRNPEIMERAAQNRIDILSMFADVKYAWVKTIPNGYGPPSWYSTIYPWFEVYTERGPIQVGHRKRVINIDWSKIDRPPNGTDVFEEMRNNSNYTVGDFYVHAWTIADGKSYIERILKHVGVDHD